MTQSTTPNVEKLKKSANAAPSGPPVKSCAPSKNSRCPTGADFSSRVPYDDAYGAKINQELNGLKPLQFDMKNPGYFDPNHDPWARAQLLGKIARDPKFKNTEGIAIDFEALGKWEGMGFTKAYVPEMGSGVTIGTGVDLKGKTASQINAIPGLSDEAKAKLKKYINLKGQAACNYLAQNPLTLGADDIRALDTWSFKEHLEKTRDYWNDASKWGGTGATKTFEQLTPRQQTALMARCYHEGPKSFGFSRSSKAYTAARAGDWETFYKELPGSADKLINHRDKKYHNIGRILKKRYDAEIKYLQKEE